MPQVMKSRLETEIDSLLSERPEQARMREKEAFDALVPFRAPLVLFGAGGFGRRTLAGLRKAGLRPVAFSDNREAAWGTKVDGLEILSPHVAVERFGATGVFVVTIWNDKLGPK